MCEAAGPAATAGAEGVPELVGARSQAGSAYTGMEREEEGEKHLQVRLRTAGD